MKKILLYGFTGLMLSAFTACSDIDNYDGPNAAMNGTVADKTSTSNFLTGQGEFSIRIWEKSWSDNPTPQDIPVKQDGTFNDTKLFSGTYDVQPYGGPFWPIERQTGVKLSGTLNMNFEITPYLHIVDVTHKLEGTNLKLTCRLQAPVTENLPRVLDIRPFVSLTQFCGDGSKIDEYAKNQYRIEVNNNWWDGVGDMATGQGTQTYTLPDLPLKSGRTFYVRIGARVDDTYKKYNYSDIIKVEVP